MDEQSVWKKEISFRRKPKKQAEPDPVAPTVEQPKQSVWKKEISFGRKRTPEPETPTVAEPAPEPVAEPEPVVVEPLPAVEAAEAVGPQPRPDPVAEPAPDAGDTWVDTSELPPEPVSSEPEAIMPEEATAELPGVPAAAAVPTVVHPPVPAAQLPPVVEERSAKPVPFWKREIAIGRRASRPKSAQPTGDAEKEPTSRPFWKPELPLGRRGANRAGSSATSKQKREKAPKPKVDRGGRGGTKLVGLKVGASQLAAARVSNNGSAELLQVAREPLSPGIVVGGELRDPDALAIALKDFFAKHKLPKRGVRLGIANNRIGVRTFDVAGIEDQKQLDNAIRFRAQEALPIPIDEAVLDYQVLGESTDPGGQTMRRILLVVAYREQIDRFVDACKKAGIQLVGIDLEAFALLRALQAPVEKLGEDASALVGVAIGHERSTFAVSDGRVCEFTRVLDWGGSALNVALARALDTAPSEVEGVKRSLSLVEDSVPEGLSVDQAAKGRDAVRRAVQSFARELVSSLQFYQNQPGSLGIGEIVLTGGTAHMSGLAVELERMIGVHVRVGDPLARIKVSKKLGEPQQLGSLAVAIGLGIED